MEPVAPDLSKRARGQWGEDRACTHYRRLGYSIVERNWRCDIGEIDILARDGDTLVVCEVKTRRGTEYGTPLEKVTRDKSERLRRLAARWMALNDVHPGDVRIDLVAVVMPPRGRAEVEHVRGAIW